ncbi:MAG: hypothetical protein JW993_02885 [Sedimentisphaerales bacterium]|nr:hypothetical protein [Sedimentisphaerales bacterium]
MKKHLIIALAVATVFAMGLVAFAQPGGGGGFGGQRGNFQARREAQMKAVEALEQAVAKLKEGMTAMGQRGAGGGQRGNFQEMTEEQRTQLMEQMRTRRQEQQDAITTIETQVVMLKGRRQLQTEHEEALAQLQAIEAQAKRENATQTAAMIAKMTQEKQTNFDQLMEKMGYSQN